MPTLVCTCHMKGADLMVSRIAIAGIALAVAVGAWKLQYA